MDFSSTYPSYACNHLRRGYLCSRSANKTVAFLKTEQNEVDVSYILHPHNSGSKIGTKKKKDCCVLKALNWSPREMCSAAVSAAGLPHNLGQMISPVF